VTVLCPACQKDNIPGTDLCEECGLDLAGLDVHELDLDAGDPLMTRPLGELPLKNPLVLSPTATVTEAIALMRERHEGCVFIEDEDGNLVGILTERDVTARVMNRDRAPRTTRLEEIMTPDPVTLQKEDPLAWALHRMGVDGYRHLPVLDGERLAGFLSVRTVLRVLTDV
jgi:CBS domain-containing protein